MTGLRPVVEVLYVDFVALAMDQIVNQAAKARYMFGGKAKCRWSSAPKAAAGEAMPPNTRRAWKCGSCIFRA